jgi:hypothetical protein
MQGNGEKADLSGEPGERRSAALFGGFGPSDMVDTLAAQGWAQADAGLARAWRESLVLERAIDGALHGDDAGGKAQAALSRLRRRLETIESVAFLLRQEIEGVARLRGLELVGDIGEALPYDPHLHNIGGLAPAEGEDVRVVAPGVVAEGRGETPLTPAEVARISRRDRQNDDRLPDDFEADDESQDR